MTGQRSTRQRTMVRAALGQSAEFQTAQELHALLHGRGESISLATVYRTLALMQEAGEIDQILADDNETSYRRCSGGHHHHLVCRDCRRTVEVSGQVVERWSAQMGEEHGFTTVSHTVELFGFCKNCAIERTDSIRQDE